MLVVVALVSAAVFAGSASAAPLASITKSGTDLTNGSTAAAGSPGITAPGDTIQWVLNVANQSLQQSNVNITDPVTGGNQTYVPGTVTTSPDWTVQSLQPDGQWAQDDAGQPNGAGAFGPVGPAGTPFFDSRSVTSGPIPNSSGANSSAGDGWEALFFGGNIYNVRHHAWPGLAGRNLMLLDCHDPMTGAECPGFPVNYVSPNAGNAFGTGPDLFMTPYAPDAAVDQTNGHIYFPVGEAPSGPDPNSIGVMCADVATQTSCGYTKLEESPVANTVGSSRPGEGDPAIGGGAKIGNRYYLPDAEGNVLCFDIAANAACGAPYPLKAVPGFNGNSTNTTVNEDGWLSQVQTFDGRYLMANFLDNNTRDLSCVDTTTDTVCAGFPKLGYAPSSSLMANMAVAPNLNAAGQTTAVCGAATQSTQFQFAVFNCYALGGATPGATVTPTPIPAPAGQIGYLGTGSVVVAGTKLYEAHANSTYTCYDYVTQAACAGYASPVSAGFFAFPYTLRQDPNHPNCIWEDGDAGILQAIDATTGQVNPTSCTNAFSTTTFASPGDNYCAGQNHVAYGQLSLGGVSASDYNGIQLSVTDVNGDPVPGWTNRVFSSSQVPVDLSSIPYSGNTTSIAVHVTVLWGSHTPVSGVSANLTWTGDPRQVCFETMVGPATCQAQTITNTANVVSTLADGTTDGPGGVNSDPVSFTEPGNPTLCATGLRRRSNHHDAQLRRAVLKITETATPGTGSNSGPGGVYHLVGINPNSFAVSHVTVCATVPPGVTVVSASSPTRRRTGLQCWTTRRMRAHQHTHFTITVLAPGAHRRLPSRATITAPGAKTAHAHATIHLTTT